MDIRIPDYHYSLKKVDRQKNINAGDEQRGVSLLIALIVLVVITLTAISVARVMRSAVNVSGNLGQNQMLNMSDDQGLYLAKLALSNAALTFITIPGQVWYNTGTGVPDETFWNACTTAAGGLATSCSPVTNIVVGGQTVKVQYMVRSCGAAPTCTLNNAFGTVGLTAVYYQVFTNATTADGAAATSKAWYLKT